MTHVMISN